MVHGAADEEPDPRGDLRPRGARATVLLLLGAALLGALVIIVVDRSRSTPPEFAGPMPLAVPSLPRLENPPAPTGALPAGLRWDLGRIVANSDGAELVYVPGGVVALGVGTDHAKTVNVKSIYVDRHEVTLRQFLSFCRATGATCPPQPGSSGEQHPVVDVGWHLAREYARWAGRRLPTEAEWQRAAMGDDGRAYPWGSVDRISARNGPGNEDGYGGLAPVGSFLQGAGPFGCLDMSGNAWEWCEDSAPPEGGGTERQAFVYRVLKGGSALWQDPLRLKSTSRGSLTSFNALRIGVGFRLVQDE